MSFNPNIHHRRSVRLKGYDYSFEGLYFITVCCQDRVCWFGNVEEGKMILNDVGRMVDKWYYELENKFHYIKCHDMVIMPNHIHLKCNCKKKRAGLLSFFYCKVIVISFCLLVELL